MKSAPSSFARVWLRVMLVLVSVFAGSCTCGPDRSSQSRKYLPCKLQRPAMHVAPSLAVKEIVPGVMPVSFAAMDSGYADLAIPITVSRGRNALDLRISYSSSAGDSSLGAGFSLSAASVITRCPKTMVMDGEIRPVQYDANDSWCVDGQRMVEVSRTGRSIEYRTFPDTQIKMMGHVLEDGPAYFEAWLPSGDRIDFGKTTETRPMAATGVPRAWLAGERRDARGNGILYDWCFADDESGATTEYALTSIRYSTFEGAEPERAVAFVYKTRDDVQTTFSHGMALQHSLELQEIQSFGPDEQLAYRYEFEMGRSASTGRTLLQSVQQCGGDGTCLAPTRFHYANVATGFDEIVTDIDAPLSHKASPMLFDIDRDGLPDYVVGDSTPLSTASNPITEWRIAKNTGGSFAAEKVALLQEWSFVQNPQGPSDPTLLQTELGTAIEVTGDSLPDLLLHDVTGSQANHRVLATKTDLTFELVDTGIRRPFPLQQSPKGLRNGTGSVHLADCDGDAKSDLIQCTDHGDTPETASLFTWKLHLWQPGGFTSTGEIIDTLTGIPCGIELHTVDANHDSVTDLIATGYLREGAVPTALSGTYSVHRRSSDGTWEIVDTGLPTPLAEGRVVFADVNGDGLPDAIESGSPDRRLYTYMNTGLGFAQKPTESLPWDGQLPQSKYFHLAQPLDFDGDSKTDLLVPMIDAISPDVPRWIILRSTGNGTFEHIESGIPFEAVLGDVVDIADPRGPRIGDVNGDGAPDVALFLSKKLHIFKNRTVDPDVLVGFSDGSNDHDPDEPEFVLNVSITYGHLIDDSKTKGQPAKDEDFYISQSDPSNGCAYPRNCVVGPKRVVSGYSVNDGQGGGRRFELRYRDARSDRLHGWLGFGERILVDADTGATTATFYDNVTKLQVGKREVYPFAGQMVEQWRWAPGLATQASPDQIEMAFVDQALEVVSTNNGKTYFTLATQTHSRRMQGSFSGAGTIAAYVGLIETLENATILRESTVDILDFDAFHNVLEVKASTAGADATMHITRTVKNDVAKWMLGLPDTQTECSTGAGLQQCRTVTRTTNEFGEVDSEQTSSSDGIDDTKLKVVYDHDKFGNVTKVTTTDAFGHKRESTDVYDDEGVFPTKHINALGHETTQEYDNVLGVLVKQTDPNGVSAGWIYDSLGRLESESRSDGSSTKIVTTREKIDGVWRLKARTTTNGGADDETISDSLGRPIQTFTHGPAVKANMPRIMQMIEYDRLSGQVARQSVPIMDGRADAFVQWDVYEFDALGREVRHVSPWNAVTTTTYNGFLVDSTDPQLKHTVTELDTLGRPKVITDAANGKTKHAYGPFDALATVTDPGGAITAWKHDAFGRVRQLDEPDRGKTLYKHNGFGDLLESTDALGRVAMYEMDALGRTTKRTDTLGAQVSTTTWTWDTAPHGMGELHSVVSPDGVKTYAYNKRGQIETIKLGVSDEVFTARIGYDDVGRVKTLDYPQPLGEDEFGVAYDYDAHGFRMGVRDKATGDAFWELKDVDNAGRYKEELFGNGTKTVRSYHDDKQTLKSITTTKGASTIQQLSYDWDKRLNLKSRTDALQPQHKTERFKVDALDRLTCAYFSPTENPGAACATSYTYAANGNLVSKSDVGTLSYNDPAHPHAVTNAPGETFTYNAVGNQITRPGGVSITYTPNDLPKTITQGAKVVSFGYDGDEQRIRKTTTNSETLYFADVFEQVTSGVVKEYRYYVQSPERTIAIVTRGGNDPGTKYLHVDHLGSTETITKDDGTVDEKRSYDPFGQRRNVIWGLPPPASFANSKVKPGFTAHDEQDEFGLVNMKGRLFDPHLGRFLNTDPVIADVFDGQMLNAFSYVGNNPLTWIDPTGFAPEMTPDVTIPGLFCCIEQTVITKYPDGFVPPPVEEDSADTDTSTMGPGDAFILPLVETEHPSGQGTDDPFGVYPPDIALARDEPATPFEQLVAGDPTGGRTTFIIEDEPGIGHDLRIAFGPARQTILLRPRIGGDMRNDREVARDRLIGEGILTAATLLTPGPVDDIAAAGMRAGARALARRGGLNVVRAGQTGEAAVRAVVDIGPKFRFKIGGKDRIADGFKKGARVLTEIKNVNKLSYTRQLRDYAAYARQEGLTFHLYVKQGAKLSKQLEQQIANKAIQLRYIP